MIVQNNSINIKQFGCIENNITDVTSYIQAAVAYATHAHIKNIYFNSNKYVISSLIQIDSISFIGNNTEFEMPIETGEPFLWFSGSNYKIANITFSLVTSNSYKYVFRVYNSNNVLIENCTLNKGADFRTNNQNFTIYNCNFYESVTIRELSSNNAIITQNVKFINCHIERREVDVDEVIWCVASRGQLRNIIFENCYIAHNGGSDNCLAVSAYYAGSSCENIQFNNCIMNFKSQYQAIHIGGSSSDTPGTTKNVIFNNCSITHTNYTTTSVFCENNSPNKVLFRNCNFSIAECNTGFRKNCEFENCKIEINSAKAFIDTVMNNCIVNDTNQSSTIFLGGAKIMNSTITSIYKIGLVQVSQYSETNQEYINCKLINSNYYMFTNDKSVSYFKLINCEINNGDNYIFVGINLTELLNWKILIQNCNFINGIDKLAGSSSYQKATFIDNYNNGEYIVGIPPTANARLIMALNTIIRADSSTGLYYKKNTDNNQSASWILYPTN